MYFFLENQLIKNINDINNYGYYNNINIKIQFRIFLKERLMNF